MPYRNLESLPPQSLDSQRHPEPQAVDVEEHDDAISDDEEMSESDWHMQQAIEASMGGGNVNPSLEEEMFGQRRGHGRNYKVCYLQSVSHLVIGSKNALILMFERKRTRLYRACSTPCKPKRPFLPQEFALMTVRGAKPVYSQQFKIYW